MKFNIYHLAFIGCLFPFAATAKDEITLFPPFEQGALVYGQAKKNVKIILNGKELKRSSTGNFVIGIAKDATEIDVNGHKIPISLKQYAIQNITGLPEKMVTPDSETQARIDRENARIEAVLKRDAYKGMAPGCMVRPSGGAVTSLYGSQRVLNGVPKDWHKGIDIAGTEGERVNAPLPGTVLLVGDFYYTGWTVIVDHGMGLKTLYAHLSSVNVAEGKKLPQGIEIGRIGSTGRATGAHLHFGVIWDGLRLDPLSAFNSFFCNSYTVMPVAIETLRLSID